MNIKTAITFLIVGVFLSCSVVKAADTLSNLKCAGYVFGGGSVSKIEFTCKAEP